MLISSWLQSFRNQLHSRPRRTTRRQQPQQRRQDQAELLENRSLLAAPTLVAIRPNVGEFLLEDEIRDSAPTELTLQFNPGQQIDADTLDGNVTLTRAGHDGTFGEINDVPVTIGYVGIGDQPETVVVRFAENLPDDHYRLTISSGLSNQDIGGDPINNGDAFNDGQNLDFNFSLDLGARIVAVDPQPVTRQSNGTLSQSRNQVVLYFNEDDLDPTAAADVTLYQLISTNQTVSNLDDVVHLPTSAVYNDAFNTVTLTFAGDIDTLSGAGTYRLRVGERLTGGVLPVAPTVFTPVTEPGPTADSANAASLGVLAGANSSITIDGEITITGASDQTDFPFDFPGADDEPGHRQFENLSHLQGTADADPEITKLFYNFDNVYGDHPINDPINGGLGLNPPNDISDIQKERAREIFEYYSVLLGIDFVETEDQGLTVATGDLRILNPGVVTGPDGVLSISALDPTVVDSGVAILNNAKGWDNSAGGTWFQAAMREIGQLLGYDDASDLPILTVNGGQAINGTPGDSIIGGSADGIPTGINVEPDFPGDQDIVHGLHLHRSDSIDVDRYNFTVPANGLFTVEVMAERLEDSSLLDSQLHLYRQLSDGTEELVAQNDDYFSEDSFIELLLESGDYSLAVSSSGNGTGGTSSGEYNLRVNFALSSDETTSLFDADVGVDGLQNFTLFDGDGDGLAGGVYNFWFNAAEATDTLFVDKLAGVGGTGDILAPFQNIDDALNAATDGQIVRIVGNDIGDDGDIANDLPYLIGRDTDNNILEDGASLDVPQNVTVMIDAGAILKLRESRIGVGSSSTLIDRSGGALQVLGKPDQNVIFTSLLDETIGTDTTDTPTTAQSGNWGGLSFQNDIDVAQGRFNYQAEGIFLNHVGQATILYGGGNAVIDSVLQPVNAINLTDVQPTIEYNRITDSADSAISANPDSFEQFTFHTPEFQNGAPEFTSDYSRVGPDIQWNTLVGNSTNGLFVRVSTTAGSEIETLSVPGRFDDLDIVHVVAQNLEIQGTPGGPILDETTPDVALTTVSVVGGVGDSTWTAAGDYNYIITFVDENGFESPASVVTASVTIANLTTDTVALAGLPTAGSEYVGRRIYRSSVGATGPYNLIAELDRSETTLADTGEAGTRELNAVTERRRARLDASLTIDPGVIVKLEGSRIQTGVGAQLIAEGTAERPIIFTSRRDDRFGIGGTFDTNDDDDAANEVEAAAGNWGGLYIGHLGSVSIEHGLITFGGGVIPVESDFTGFNALEIHQAEARIRFTDFVENAAGQGGSAPTDRFGLYPNEEGTIFVRGAQPVILDNRFSDNSGPIITINANAVNSRRLLDPGRSTGGSDHVTEFIDNQGPLIRNNTFEGNDINGMVVRGEVVTTQGVWDDTDIVHVLQDEIFIPNFHASGGIRLESNANQSLVIKHDGPNAGITVGGDTSDIVDRIGGILHIVGQPGSPVVLTSINDDTAGAGFDLAGFPQFDTNNDGNTQAPSPGDWRGIVIGDLAHDRNVGVYVENEIADADVPDTNSTIPSSEVIGLLAQDEFSGDDTLRLGFEVHGAIDSSDDADVYSVSAVAGEQIWIDIDETSQLLDTVIEVLDAAGNVLATSDNNDVTIPAGGTTQAFPLDFSQYVSRDLYTLNALDAGLRIVLPGSADARQNYFVRVSSANDTRGAYELSIRLQELDEFAGTQILYADVRYAEVGIQVPAAPLHSPLTAERIEDDTPNTITTLGELLDSDRAVFTVSGTLASPEDVNSDLYSFTLRAENTDISNSNPPNNPNGAPFETQDQSPVPVVFDIDFADGQARPNTTIAVYADGGNNELVLIGTDSNIADDQERESEGSTEDTLSRGSYGNLDPFIGPFELPPGDYFVQVLASNQIPSELLQYHVANPGDPGVRLEPVSSTTRIAEDRLDPWITVDGVQTQADVRINPAEPITDLFESIFNPFVPAGAVLDPQHSVEHHLGDLSLFVSGPGFTGTNRTGITTVNPFTGFQETQVGQFNTFIGDIAIRDDGQLHAFTTAPNNGFAGTTAANVGNYLQIDTGNGTASNLGDDSITANLDNQNATDNNVTLNPNAFFTYQAITYTGTGVGDLFAVGTRSDRTAPATTSAPPAAADSTNVLWNLRSDTGAVIGDGANRVNDARALDGAGTTEREIGVIAANGTITGLADSDAGTFAVDGLGFLYEINLGNAGILSTSAVGGGGIAFAGLAAGPATVEGGIYADLFFGIDTAGDVFAFDTDGELQPVFANGATSIATGITNPSGLAFGTLESNLWQITRVRGGQDGHGVEVPPDDSQQAPSAGGTSLYFGNQSTSVAAGNKNTSAGNLPIAQASGIANGVTSGAANNIDFPGGAQGTVISNSFSLEDYSSADKPYLYFNYFLETDGTDFDFTTTMQDSFRVYVQDASGEFSLVTTNNTFRDPVLGDEFDFGPFGTASAHPLNQSNPDVVEAFDNTGNWRQARIDLSNYAGLSDLKLRFEFSTAGSSNVGNFSTTGFELYGVSGDQIDDGEVVAILRQGGTTILEFDQGPIVDLPTGDLAIGGSVTVDGTVFDITTTAVTPTDVVVLSTDSAAEVAEKVAATINLQAAAPPEVAFVSDNRLNIPASTVTSTFDVAGADGVQAGRQAVEINIAMTDVEVAEQIQRSLAIANNGWDPNVVGDATNDFRLTAVKRDENLVRLISNIHAQSMITLNAGSAAQLEGDTVTATVGPIVETFTLTATPDPTDPRQVQTSDNMVVTATNLADAIAALTGDGINFGTETSVFLLGGDFEYTDSAAGDAGAEVIYVDFPNSSPLGLTASLPGDAFGEQDGNLNPAAGSLRGQANNVEGVYVDDIIIGFAERGEFVTSNAVANQGAQVPIVANPDFTPGNTTISSSDILSGSYDLEVRRTSDYAAIPPQVSGTISGATPLNTIDPTNVFDTNDRQAQQVSVTVPEVDQIANGALVTLSDGINSVIFEYQDQSQGAVSATPGNILIGFNPTTNEFTYSGTTYTNGALALRDAINSDAVAGVVDIVASLSDGTSAITAGESAIVNLYGNAIVTPDAAGTFAVESFDLYGDENHFRDQGQIIIDSSIVRNSAQFGIVAASPLPTFTRTLLETNPKALVPGVTIVNNLIYENGAGGIQINGQAAADAVVPIPRIVNNTIAGDFNGGVPVGGTGIQVVGNAAPTIMNNIVADYTTWINITNANAIAESVLGSNLYRGAGSSNSTGSLGDGTFSRTLNSDPTIDPLFVDQANGNFYLAPSSQAIDSGLASLADRPELVNVKDAIGIGISPTLAPDDDLFGQVRGDDFTAPNTSGQGATVFVDRGAIDRVDVTSPTARIVDPLDGSPRDLDADLNEVLINDATIVTNLTIQLVDQGIGIDDIADQTSGERNVSSDQFQLFVRDLTAPGGLRLLVENVDYVFTYNAFTQEVSFQSVSSFPVDRIYEIWVNNTDPDGVRDLAGNFISANRTDGSTKFFIALSDGVNDDPINIVPDSQTVAEDSILTFSNSTANLIQVTDDDVALGTNELTVTFAAARGTVSTIPISGVTQQTSAIEVTQANQVTVAAGGSMLGQSVFIGNTRFNFVSDTTTNPRPTDVLINAATADADVALALADTINHDQNFGTGTASAVGAAVNLTGVTAADPSSPFIALDGATLTAVDGATSIGHHFMVGGTIFSYVDATDTDLPSVQDIPVNAGDTANDIAIATASFLNTTFGAGTASSGGSTVTIVGLNTEPNLLTLSGDAIAINAAISSVVFTPDADYFGPASVTVYTQDGAEFTFQDRQNGFDQDVISIDVIPVNDRPSMNSLADVTIDEDAPTQTVNLTGITPGPDGNIPPNEVEDIRITATSNNAALIPDPTVNYSFFDTTGNLQFTPVANAFGSATITVLVEDAGLDGLLNDDPLTTGINEAADNLFSIAEQFEITVNPVNDAPTLAPIADQTIDEDTGPGSVNLTGISAGPSGESEDIRFSIVTSSSDIVVNPTISYTAPNTTAVLSYDLVPDAFGGPITVTVTVEDAGLDNDFGTAPNLTTSQTFTIFVNPVNDLPTIDVIPDDTHFEDGGPKTLTLEGITNGAANETEPVVITAVSSDPSIISDPVVIYNHPALTGQLTYTPEPDMFTAPGSPVTITVRVEDGGLDGFLSTTADNGVTSTDFEIVITPVNDPPTIDNIADVTVAEDSSTTTVNLSGITTGAFNEFDTLVVTAVSSNPTLIANPSVTYTSPNDTGSLSFAPEADQFGTATITVNVFDGTDTTSTTFTITVDPVNDPPELDAIADQVIDEDTGPGTVNLTGIVNGPANEPEDVRLTAVSSDTSIVLDPSITYTSLDTTGILNYDLVGDANGGPVTIVVTITDAGLDGIFDDNPSTLLVNEAADNLTSQQSFNIIVDPVNDPPTLDAISDLNIDEDAPVQTVNLTGITNGPANELEGLTITAVSSDTSLIPDPSVNYTFDDTTGSLSLQPVADQHGTATITVTVTDNGLDNVAGTADDLITTQMFDIVVNPVNDAPTIGAIADQTTAEDSTPASVTVTGIGTGAANEVQDLRVTATSNNPAILLDPTVTYTSPEATATLDFTLIEDAFGGPITVTVTVEDAGLDGTLGTVDDGVTSTTFDFVVTPVNDDPTLDDLADMTIDEDAPTQTVTLTGITNGPSNETEQVRVSAVSSDPSLIPNPTVDYTNGSTTGSLSFTPVADQFGGPVTITVTVEDAGLDDTFDTADDASIQKTFDVVVNPINDAPTLNTIPTTVAFEDSGVQTIGLSGIAAGPANETEGTRVTATINSGSTLIVPGGSTASGQVITVDGVDFTYVSQPSTVDTDIVIIDIETLVTVDSTFEVAEATTEAINNYFGAGTATASGNTVNTALPISTTSPNLRALSATDVISTPTVSFNSGDSNGVLSFFPLTNAFGSVSLTVTVHDDGLDGVPGTSDDSSTSRQATIIVNAVNDLPQINSLPDLSLPVDAGTQTIDLTGILNGPFNELEQLRISVVSSDESFIPTPTINYTPNNPSGTLTFTPAAGQAGAANISIILEDAGVDGVFIDPVTPQAEEADNLAVTISFRVSTAPIIQSPIGTTTDNTPLFTFTPVPASAGYEIEIFNVTEDVSVDLPSAITPVNSFQVPEELPMGEYRIRVRAIDGAGDPGLYSDAITLFVAPTPNITAPTLDRLPDSTPTFSWASVFGAETYTVSIVNDLTNETVFASDEQVATQLTVPATSELPLGRYRYTVTAINNPTLTSTGDAVSSSTTQFLTVSTPPEVQLPAAAIYDTRPTITWVQPAAAVVSDVEVFNVTENRLELLELGVAGTSYTLTPQQELAPGEYRVRVVSYGDANRTIASDYSTVHVFQVGAAPVLLGPANGASRTTDQQPTLRWEGSLAGETYNVWLTDLSTGTTLYRPTGLITESYQPPANLPIGRYRYWVQANTDTETSRWSVSRDFEVVTPPTLIPGPSSTFNQQPTIEWDALDGAVQYRVWLNKTDEVPARRIEVTFVEGTSYQISEELPNGRYAVWVQGISDNNDNGVESTISNWSTPYRFEVGGRPTVTHASVTADRTPTLTWEAVGDATSYEIFFSSDVNPSEPIIRLAGINATSYTLTEELDPGVYRFWVRATGPEGQTTSWSLFSTSVLNVESLTRPTLNQVTGTSRTPLFSWNAVNGAIRYQLYVAPANDVANAVINNAEIATNSYTPTEALTPGSYRAWVKAIAADNSESGWSIPVDFTVVSNQPQQSPSNLNVEFLLTSAVSEQPIDWQQAEVTVSQIPARVVSDLPMIRESVAAIADDSSQKTITVPAAISEPEALNPESNDAVMADWDQTVWEAESAQPANTETKAQTKTGRGSLLAGIAGLAPALIGRRRRRDNEN